MVRKIIFTLYLLVMSCSTAWAEKLIQVEVKDEKLYEDTSFLLLVTAAGKFEKADLDPRPLTDSFTIGDIMYKYREYENSTIWGIPLITHSNGLITIPSILIKDNVSEPLSISVRKKQGRDPRPVLNNLINTEISNLSPFTNETVILKTTVTKPHNVELSSFIIPPSVDENGHIHLLHESRSERSTMGHTRTVITSIYAVSFKTPGTHTINPAIANGYYIESNGNTVISNDNKDRTIKILDPSKGDRDAGKRVRFVYQEKPLTIKAADALKGKSNVVVAEDFKIVETWNPEKNSTLSVNTPIVHEITFSGTGISAQDLPPRIIEGTPQYKAYTDKEKITEHYDPETGILTSSRTFSQVFVPLRSMKLLFAPDEINWVHRTYDEGTKLSTFTLTSPSYEIVDDGEHQYDFTNRNLTKILLLIVMGLIILLITVCIIYLLYLENIIIFDRLINWNARRVACKKLIKNFDTKDVKNAYSQLIEFGQTYFGPGATCFEKFPNYEEFKIYLDDIAEKRWDHGKSFVDRNYDGTEFKKKLKKFCRKPSRKIQAQTLLSQH